jgi:hypothetical protein
MEIDYRLFFDKNNEPIGIAYNGYEDVPPDRGITCLIYGRMNLTYTIEKPIDSISIEDIRYLGFNDSYHFGVPEKANLPGTGYTPCNIVEEHQELYLKRKTA